MNKNSAYLNIEYLEILISAITEEKKTAIHTTF